MKVLKFGGTSVGSPQRMHNVAKLVNAEDKPVLVVLSAVSGTTNTLIEIGNAIGGGDKEKATKLINTLYQQYQGFYKELLSTEAGQENGKKVVEEHFSFIRSLMTGSYGAKQSKELVAQGELLSTKLFYEYLKETQYNASLLPALDFMYIDEYNEPVLDKIEERLRPMLQQKADCNIFITQGFICRNPQGEVDNLKRGGSDFTASLIGAAIRSEEVQIWTDIDGMHNNDPRIVKKTFPIAELSFEEAAELAYFGAKILHPSTIVPAQKYNVPVRLLNTMQPEAKGTIITDKQSNDEIKAIAAKDGITAIKIKSSRMLLAYGFLRKVFEIFEKYRTPIDMITTSEVAISLTIDDRTHLNEILNELKVFGNVEVDADMSIICIVGDLLSQKKEIVKKVFNSLDNINIRMISYGGSKRNISLLVKSTYKNDALNALNEGLFTF